MEDRHKFETPSLRYAGIPTLLRRPLLTDPSGVDIALIGVPYDGATETDQDHDMDLVKYVICRVSLVLFIT